MNNFKYKFTIFTPVYNRKHTVHRVWDSLKSQTYRDFEWIIVDDGSTDNVMPLLEEYKQVANFPVTILRQKNSGKHIAWNQAIDIAYGELFVPADSDDAFVPETLKRFLHHWNNIPKGGKNKFSGINCLCKDPETGEIVGEKFPDSPLISNNLELFYKYKIRGEKWGCIRTDLLKKNKFPDNIKSTHFPESYLWFSIAREYKNLSINEPLRFYYQDSGNMISKKMSKDIINSAPVNFHYLIWDLNTNLDYMLKYRHFTKLLKSYANLWRLGLLLDSNVREIYNKMKGFSKIIAILTLPPSLLIYYFTYRRLKE
jgi:glycosyltransferase involved in cell wall biosynthesis